jgi:O-antigen/teichoic acid export membrane protein
MVTCQIARRRRSPRPPLASLAAVTSYLKRLLAGGAAYQAAAVLAAALAVLTLPLYTRSLSPADYGYAETLLTSIILASILLRLGIGEAFVRFWFDDEDPARRLRLARTTTAVVGLSTTAATLAGLAAAGPLSRALLGTDDATLMACGLLGLWAFTNLEVAYALLRVEERRGTYAAASAINVVLTVVLTVLLVVVLDWGARGYVLGNYAASTAVLLGLWWREREKLAVRPVMPLGPLLRFGAPTIPAEATVFTLNVIDRAYLLRAESPAAAGLYAVAVKLATAVIVVVRGFQAAWPPLAYSVRDDAQAGRLYALVTTAYVAVTGLSVAAITLLGRWLVRLLAAPDYYAAHRALPWLALGWALYGLNLVFVTIAGRAKVTTRNFPAAAAGVLVNVVVLVALIPPLGIAGAGIALAAAYLVMLALIHALTRRLFVVPFEWGRLGLLVGVLTGVTVAGELLLPDHGAAGLLSRAAALALIPAVLWAAGFVRPHERERVVAALRARRAAT